VVIASKRLRHFSGGRVTIKLGHKATKRLKGLRRLSLTVRVLASQPSGPPLVTTKKALLRR
jgi:hypothetical protein